MLSDSICLFGHGFLALSHRRRSYLRPYLNDRFQPICNQDVPVDSLLFGADAMKKMKELGDYTKIPIANSRFRFTGNARSNCNGPKDNLNLRGPAYRQGMGF